MNATQVAAEMAGTLDSVDDDNGDNGNGDDSDQSDDSNDSGNGDDNSDDEDREIIPIVDAPFVPKYSCNSPDQRGASQNFYRRLTRSEVHNTLRQLFGAALMDQVQVELALIPNEEYGNYAERFSPAFTQTHLEAMNGIGEALSRAAMQDSVFVQRYSSCTSLTAANCVAEFVENFGARVLRRPLTAAEITTYTDAFNADADVDAGTIIHSFLLNADFMLLVELGLEDNASRLTPYEVASRISYRTIKSSPDDILWAAAQNNQLQTITQVQAQVERLLATDAGRESIRQFFRDWLEVDEEPDVSVTDSYRNDLDIPSLYESAKADFDRFIDYIVWDTDGSLHDLFLDASVFPNSEALAGIYGTEISPSVAVTANNNYQGVLLRAATLMGGSNVTPIIHRGVMIRRKLLCDILPTPSQDIINSRDDSASPEDTDHALNPNRVVVTNLTKNDTCMTCHSLINPLGFSLEGYDSLGRIQATERVYSGLDEFLAEHPIDTLAYDPLIEANGTNALKDGNDLVLALTVSSKLKSCFATQLYRHQMLARESTDDQCSLREREDLISDPSASILDVMIMNVANEDIFWRGN